MDPENLYEKFKNSQRVSEATFPLITYNALQPISDTLRSDFTYHSRNAIYFGIDRDGCID